MPIDHARAERRVTQIDDLLHDARCALKAKVYGETYLRGARKAEEILEEAGYILNDLIADLENDS